MKYVISQYGIGFAVGLIQAEEAQTDMCLAQNLFDCHVDENIFHGAILFDSMKQIRRFLAYKEFYNARMGINTPNEFPYWKYAFRRAKEILNNACQYQNFMFQLTGR